MLAMGRKKAGAGRHLALLHRLDQSGLSLGRRAVNFVGQDVEEIFDVQLLPGLHFPEVVGFQKEAVNHTFIVKPA